MSTFYTGDTGRGTGPHLDFRIWDVGKGGYINPSSFSNILSSNGRPVSELFPVTSGYGNRIHPVLGGVRMHDGIDYGTPSGTPINVAGGTLLATYDGGSGGIMSQYAFERDGRQYEALLLHGSSDNPITSDSFVSHNRQGVSGDTPSLGQSDNSGPTTGSDNRVLSSYSEQSPAERAEDFKNMSVNAIKAAYDKERTERPATANEIGLEMHRAHFRK